jgi:hypothetical protein
LSEWLLKGGAGLSKKIEKIKKPEKLKKSEKSVPGPDELYTVGFWMYIQAQSEAKSKPRLAMWRWDRGKVKAGTWKNCNWTTTVVANSPIDAVKKGQQIAVEESKKVEKAA